jgi:hypothetical protein
MCERVRDQVREWRTQAVLENKRAEHQLKRQHIVHVWLVMFASMRYAYLGRSVRTGVTIITLSLGFRRNASHLASVDPFTQRSSVQLSVRQEDTRV